MVGGDGDGVDDGVELTVSVFRQHNLTEQFYVHFQLQSAFKDKEDENQRLKTYIDTILLNIVENYPQLLEVKGSGGSSAIAMTFNNNSK